jgi:hypothetical protein
MDDFAVTVTGGTLDVTADAPSGIAKITTEIGLPWMPVGPGNERPRRSHVRPSLSGCLCLLAQDPPPLRPSWSTLGNACDLRRHLVTDVDAQRTSERTLVWRVRAFPAVTARLRCRSNFLRSPATLRRRFFRGLELAARFLDQCPWDEHRPWGHRLGREPVLV